MGWAYFKLNRTQFSVLWFTFFLLIVTDNNRAGLFTSDSNSIIHLLFIANHSTIVLFIFFLLHRKIIRLHEQMRLNNDFSKDLLFILILHAIRLRDRYSLDNVIDMAFIYLMRKSNRKRTSIVFFQFIKKNVHNFGN